MYTFVYAYKQESTVLVKGLNDTIAGMYACMYVKFSMYVCVYVCVYVYM